MNERAESGAIRIWALLGARAGDNDQVLALAEALGLPFEVKQLHYNRLNRLGPRLLGRSLASLSRASRRLILSGDPPDLTISTGHRSVPVVRALKRRSGGRMLSIHVGFPRVSPGHFDLVIATPQYAAEDDPNLLRIPFALTRAATARASLEVSPELDALPSPRRLLIVGGPTLFWNLDEPRLMQVLDQMLDEAHANGGSVAVTTSPRTPLTLRARIAAALDTSPAPTLLAEPRRPPSYASLVRAADSIRITADSVSMISDAIWARKPLRIVPVAKSGLGKVGFGLNDRLRPGSPIYPQDLRFFWRALAAIGVGEELAMPRTSPAAVMDMVLERVGPIIDSIGRSDTLY